MPQIIEGFANEINDNKYEQIIKYQELKESIDKIPSLITNISKQDQKCKEQALAFLVEATMLLEPQEWQSRLHALAERIQNLAKQYETDPHHAQTEVSWIIAQLVDDVYEKILAYQAVNASRNGDAAKQAEYSRGLSLNKSLDKLAEALHRINEPVGFGVIMPDLVPTWYQDLNKPLTR